MSKKILLIEDDPFLASLLKNRFQKENLDIQLVKSGDEAVKALKSDESMGLVLLDLILPGKSGFEILETIKADPQTAKVPVIIISNLGQDSDMQKGKELGAADYLVKSRISIDFLVKRVRDALK